MVSRRILSGVWMVALTHLISNIEIHGVGSETSSWMCSSLVSIIRTRRISDGGIGKNRSKDGRCFRVLQRESTASAFRATKPAAVMFTCTTIRSRSRVNWPSGKGSCRTYSYAYLPLRRYPFIIQVHIASNSRYQGNMLAPITDHSYPRLLASQGLLLRRAKKFSEKNSPT